MNTDIRIAVSFRYHRKRKKLELLLGSGATGFLIDLWIGVAVSRPDGVLNGWDEIDLALEAGYPGDPNAFVDALCTVGFLDNCDGVYVMHDWQEHNPYATGSEERSDKARMSKLKQAYPGLHKKLIEQGFTSISAKEYRANVSEWLANRQRNASDSLAPSPSPSPSPKEENKTASAEADIVPDDPPEQPKKSWRVEEARPEWFPEDSFRDLIEHRKKKKATNTKRALSALLNQIDLAMGEGFGLEEIVDEITNRNWSGFKAEWMREKRTSKRQEHEDIREQWAKELLEKRASDRGNEGVVNQIQGPGAESGKHDVSGDGVLPGPH